MKRIILSLFALCSLAAYADDAVWCMVTNNNDVIAMSNVGYIVNGGSEAETFSIVLADNTSVNGVGQVKFYQLDLTAISQIKSTADPMISGLFGDDIYIQGVADGTRVQLYTVSGQQLRSTSVAGGVAHLSIGDLTRGVYVLSVGGKSVKFIKK